jgi:hypothetical protein
VHLAHPSQADYPYADLFLHAFPFTSPSGPIRQARLLVSLSPAAPSPA